MKYVGVALGLRVGWGSLGAGRVVSVLLIAAVVTAAVAVVERTAGPLNAPSRTLSALFGIIVPLVAVAMVGLSSGRDRLGNSSWSVARYGFTRSHVVLGTLVSPLAITVASALALTALALGVSYGGRPGLSGDLALSLPIAAVGSWAYFSAIALGATFFPRGYGRWAFFALDLVLGATDGAFALIFPRAHLESLLGGAAVLDLSQEASGAALFGIAATATFLTIQRAGR